MRFEKGNSLGGRTPGSKNKVTQKIRESFSDLINNNLEKLQSDLNEIEPKDRLRIIIDMASYVIPKLKAVEVTRDATSDNADMIQRLLNIDDKEFEKEFNK